MVIKKLLILFCAIIIIGCSYTNQLEKSQESTLTTGEVKTTIIKGQTDQSEILKKFGSPNLVTINKNEEEVWNYNRMSYETRSGSEGGTLIFFGGSKALSTSTTKSFDLIITFDKNDVVKDYTVISAKY